MSGVSITLVKRLTSVRRHPADRGFAANNRKKTLAPRVGSGLRQIELKGTVLWEHYNNNNNDNNNIHLYSAFLLVTQSALQLVNT